MKKYIAVIEIGDDEEIVGDANISYTYCSNGTNYGTDESVELKAEDEKQRMKTYEDGLNEAWEAARKIACLSSDDGYTMEDLIKIFGLDCVSTIFKKQSANEAVTKIKEYENRIEVGDEVYCLDINYPRVVTCIFEVRETGDIKAVSFASSGKVCVDYVSDLKKTGRHFTQIEEVLKQMKESN